MTRRPRNRPLHPTLQVLHDLHNGKLNLEQAAQQLELPTKSAAKLSKFWGPCAHEIQPLLDQLQKHAESAEARHDVYRQIATLAQVDIRSAYNLAQRLGYALKPTQLVAKRRETSEAFEQRKRNNIEVALATIAGDLTPLKDEYTQDVHYRTILRTANHLLKPLHLTFRSIRDLPKANREAIARQAKRQISHKND